ncbi:MAG: hypothetical protein K2Z81_12830, partial [Cyanobacteria bacterium]|nr:hypothetical protein [Cyanobacteriota bacterium]
MPIYEWLDRHEPIVFPRPKGKYSVGRKCFHWIDSEREEKFVEGVGTYKGESYWWGGNLMGVRDR